MRRIVKELEGEEGIEHLDEYTDANTERGQCLLYTICTDPAFAEVRSKMGLNENSVVFMVNTEGYTNPDLEK